MNKNVTEQYGKTVEEAIRKGLEELKVSRDDVKIQVIDQPSNGLLGMLSSKMAKVRLTICKQINEDTIDNTIKRTREIVDEIFRITGDTSTYELVRKDEKLVLNITSPNSAHLIGYKGRTMESLQSVINGILQREEEECTKIFIEVNDYKQRKEERLVELAHRMERNAVKYHKDIRLDPMPAYERLIIHRALADSKLVTTESVGQEPRRRLIIRLKR